MDICWPMGVVRSVVHWCGQHCGFYGVGGKGGFTGESHAGYFVAGGFEAVAEEGVLRGFAGAVEAFEDY